MTKKEPNYNGGLTLMGVAIGSGVVLHGVLTSPMGLTWVTGIVGGIALAALLACLANGIHFSNL